MISLLVIKIAVWSNLYEYIEHSTKILSWHLLIVYNFFDFVQESRGQLLSHSVLVDVSHLREYFEELNHVRVFDSLLGWLFILRGLN